MYFNGYLVENQGYKEQTALQLLIKLGQSIQPKEGLRVSVYLVRDVYQCLKYPEVALQPQSPRPRHTGVFMKVLRKLVLLRE